ncbi:unnamed protein product [Dracunculus medinensis]|uniref:DIX domain-containing protein n=1 Tax=Dracunculus medinensis TaxID=318479 RepID=A0A0N4UNM9_DRAME|nr:unnamed protein product [Dracunculus medinensis]
MCAKKNSRAAELARNLHQRYVSLNTGVCSFLPENLRREVSAHVHSLLAAEPDPTIFDCLCTPVEQFLRQQHALFVCSEEFLDAFNKVDDSFSKLSKSTNITQATARKSKKVLHQPMLTAEMLLKTQYERENAFGESEVEKMYRPAVKVPYVCNATTSKNDSAVSSTFSSDANGQTAVVKLSTIREEQLRGNPVTHTLARVEKMDSGLVMTHCTEEGRKAFAALLIEKLNLLSAKRRRNDVMNQQLRDIQSRKCSAREIVNDMEPTAAEEDDELERYVRQRMADDSCKPSPSYHSPDYPNAHSLRYRRRSPKSSPPERFRNYTASLAVEFNSPYMINPYSSNGFAPPPCSKYNRDVLPAKPASYEVKSLTMYDTSGIESMAPSLVHERDELQRAAIFQKARLLSANSHTNRKVHKHSDFSSLPRMKGNDSKPLITISYKQKNRVPIVAHVSLQTMTFRDFRKYLGISSKSNQQVPIPILPRFFFKTACEDGNSPYQLLLVNDDSTILPVYEGRITAECKSISDSE